MFCPECKAEYVKGIKVCADCEVPLVEKLPEEKKERIVRVEYEELLYTPDQGLVVIIKSILDNAGITYYFQGDRFAHLYPVPARLFIKKEEIQEARDLLKDFIQSNGDNQGTP